MADEWTSHPDNDGNFSKGDKIPLQKCWTFWFFKPQTSPEDVELMQPLDDFDTVQDFWACYNALPSPITLGPRQCFHMMKQGVRPEWDDDGNQRGGIWTFKVDKQIGTEVWQTLCLATIGEQFASVLPRQDDICGLTAKGGPPNSSQLILQVWHKDESYKGAVYDKLKTVLSKLTDINNSYYRANAEETRKAVERDGKA